jgi:RNA polymerase sigma-70 factor (family 1)
VALISIAEIKSGSELSFTSVFDRCHVKVYHYFLKRTGSPESAKELVQLTFIKLWQFKHTLSEEHSLDLQLFNIARSTLIDYIRRENFQRKNIIDISEKTFEGMKSMQVHAGGGFEKEDYLRFVIRSLSPVRKKVFILSRIQGHSYKEIAEHLSISVKTVEDHMGKATRHIRSIASHLLVFLVFFLLY